MNLYKVLYDLFAGFVRGVFRVQVTGAENEPAEGAYIACANHLSNIDVLILAAVLKRQLRFLAKAELFRLPLSRRIFNALGAYPVKRGTGDVGAIRKTLALLDEGEAVGYFPQGTRCPGKDPAQTEPKSGVGLISYRSRAVILPISISNKKYRIAPFRRTYVNIGKPIAFDELSFTTGTREEINRAAGRIFDSILTLDEEIRKKTEADGK